ncbi:MAG: histidinol-phosphate aminotransferase family protein, partial [Anaerolineaceae bacterium]|nr:histidinol-phosphate aminotransferase family protein [Anaerolineaceae bacterium]
PKLCFICNPNNPTGTIIPNQLLESIIHKYPETGFVVDEAYLPFIPDKNTIYNEKLDNLLVLHSLTKDYALAGIRLGYVIGNQKAISVVSKVLPAWSVNSIAQAAGAVALSTSEFMAESNHKLITEKEILVSELELSGFIIPHSKTHYFIMKVGKASDFRQNLLLKHRIQVRDCTSFGLPEYVRISTRKKEDNQKLVFAINDLINQDLY